MFSEYLEKESVFKNKELLDTSYKPDEILHRDSQIDELASILAPSLKGDDPSNLFVYGTVGTGKSLCVKHVSGELREAAEKSEESLKIVHVNCKMKKVADTEYRLSAQLARELGEEVPSTGLPTDEVYDRFFTALEEGEEDVVIIILDEIDALVKKIGDSFLYNLTRINDDLEDTKVSIVGISNDLNFTEYMDSRVKSSLSEEEIIFPPYNALELKEILLQRTEDAFHDDVLADGVVSKCAALAASEHGDARRALDLLRVAGELTERSNESQATIEFVDRAQEKIEKDRLKETIRSQPKQSKLLLYVVLKNYEEGSKLATGDIYSEYKEYANDAGVKVLTQRRVSDLIAELDMLGVINGEVVSKGRHGRTRQISVDLSDNAQDDLEDMLEETLYL
ncbi:MAG: orc1/cdc6 family replication initiation protein [Candidatus Nanohaloarchaeota archaeon QJJ-7]|nr:orc1/cdc6 family replication initiation protein [Candidatus Nanohaloarchaeota archaeon QJJ-7]